MIVSSCWLVAFTSSHTSVCCFKWPYLVSSCVTIKFKITRSYPTSSRAFICLHLLQFESFHYQFHLKHFLEQVQRILCSCWSHFKFTFTHWLSSIENTDFCYSRTFSVYSLDTFNTNIVLDGNFVSQDISNYFSFLRNSTIICSCQFLKILAELLRRRKPPVVQLATIFDK